MRLLHIVPYAVLILLAEAAVGSVPGIVAAREGGMGLGSALIVAQAAQVAGVVLGAIVAAYLVGRWSVHVALIGGALLYYAGLIGVGHQPSHLLGWVVVILGLAGSGLGMVLTAAFSAAAGVGARERPAALVLLLLAPLAAGLLAGSPVFALGPPTLVAVAAIMLAGAMLGARSSHGRPVPERSPSGAAGGNDGLTARVALGGGGVLAIGVLAMLWGIEPSRVSAAMVAGSLGVSGFASLDDLRLGLVVLGLAAVGAGILLLSVRARPSRPTILAAAASAPAALAVAGLIAIAGFAMPRELSPPDSAGGPLGELAAVAGGVSGLVLGAWLLRGPGPRAVASVGGLVLAGLSLLVLAGAGAFLQSSGAVGPIAVIAVTAFGGGLTAVALRLLLAEAPTGERGLAAAAGVAGASIGAMVGLMIGAGEGMARAIGVAEAMSAGSVVLVAASLAALAIAAALPSRRPPAESIPRDSVGATA